MREGKYHTEEGNSRATGYQMAVTGGYIGVTGGYIEVTVAQKFSADAKNSHSFGCMRVVVAKNMVAFERAKRCLLGSCRFTVGMSGLTEHYLALISAE